MSKIDNNGLDYAVPNILEFERSALNIVKKDTDNKEEIKELLKEYAARYAKENASGF